MTRLAAILLVASIGATSACQGPPQRAPLDVHAAVRAGATLGASLRPLEAAFDAHCAVPRVVALLPARCEACASGVASLRRSILEAFPREPYHVFVLFERDARCEGCGAAAVSDLVDPRVTVFRDDEGFAARAFARGLLPVAEAREVFLFYPRGMRWRDEAPPRASPAGVEPGAPGLGVGARPRPGDPPRADEWWHSLGRIAPERYCATLELDSTLRATMAQLLVADDAPSVAKQ